MRRMSVVVCLFIAAALVGCEQPQASFGPLEKPDPAPELAQLNRLVGTWEGTAEMVEPSPEEMKKHMPPGQEMPSSFAGGSKAQWILGGTCLLTEGWHEMGEGKRVNMHEMIVWDKATKKFRSFYFSDWGEVGEGCMTPCADGKGFCFKAWGTGPEGKKMSGGGTMRFVDDNTMEWTWCEKGAHGSMKLKGTSRRKS